MYKCVSTGRNANYGLKGEIKFIKDRARVNVAVENNWIEDNYEMILDADHVLDIDCSYCKKKIQAIQGYYNLGKYIFCTTCYGNLKFHINA
jgi:hypothetical protein